MQRANEEFVVKFRGVRGSYSLCSEKAFKYGGNTSCVEVNINGHKIILDSGSGIIELGNELFQNHNCADTKSSICTIILISHCHYDHISGLPFFKPAYINTSNIHLFGHNTDSNNFKDIIPNFIKTPYFPLNFEEIPATINIHSICPKDTIILTGDSNKPEIKQLNSEKKPNLPENMVIISSLKSSNHPKDGVLIFKITYKDKNMVFATDIEGSIEGDTDLIEFSKDADLLIHDSQFIYEDYNSSVAPKRGYGHSTPEMAANIAKLANVKNLVLYHMDPSYDNNVIDSIENTTKKLFNNTIAAKEGLEIKLL